MKALQWSMTIPKNKQRAFIKWFNDVAGPLFAGYGAKKHELYKVEERRIVGKQIAEKDRFIERVYFDDNFDIPSYFTNVKANLEAWKISRMYEGEFGAKDIELRVLLSSSIEL